MASQTLDGKIYCCSNSSRSEGKKLGICDIILSIIGLIMAAWLTEMVKHHEEYFRNITENSNSTLTDLNFLIDLNVEEQNYYFATILLWQGWAIALGGTLFYASLKSREGLLKVWFGITAFLLLMEIILTCIALFKSERKIVSGTVGLMFCLYKWYGLWIVKRIIKDIRSESGIYDISTERNKPINTPSLVIVSPTPDPDSINIIDIDGHSVNATDETNRPQSSKSNNGHIKNVENG